MITLAPHQQRVVDEKNELSERLSKLLSFFQTPIFAGLDAAERTRLRNQARFMDGYLAVLEERIAAFGDPVENERNALRAAQAAAVMPLIGPLMDAWENADREVMEDEPELVKQLTAIQQAMETAA